MGHKVHPKIYRIPNIYVWDSRWFGKKEQISLFLKQEIEIRTFLGKKLKEAGVDSFCFERTPKEMTITILVAKPGVVIGRSGQVLEELRKEIEKKYLGFKLKVKINVLPLKQPALSAQVIAQTAAMEIEKRKPFRRVMKQILEKTIAAGAKGIKVNMSGRLNGAEIARREVLSAGKMSLITIRSDVDYAFAEANTIYGKIGVKIWVYFGEAFGRRDKFEKRDEKN
ncbi:MAG: 30S ribosomal protein S3 [Candidatus Magasanikbacteria bacterium]|nr:30S ribosomal protein S3 [Candidatus Magasanikbacteria bacterium]